MLGGRPPGAWQWSWQCPPLAGCSGFSAGGGWSWCLPSSPCRSPSVALQSGAEKQSIAGSAGIPGKVWGPFHSWGSWCLKCPAPYCSRDGTSWLLTSRASAFCCLRALSTKLCSYKRPSTPSQSFTRKGRVCVCAHDHVQDCVYMYVCMCASACL